MVRDAAAGVLLADLRLQDLLVPADPEAVPSHGVDAGVLPLDMVDHLRVATVFPVAPTVWGRHLPLEVVGGGRCVWAAGQVGWSRPIRCVVLGPPPAGVATRTLPEANTDASGPPQLVHSAAFATALTGTERQQVTDRLEGLARRLAAAGVPLLGQQSPPRWTRPDLLQFAAPPGPGSAAAVGPALWQLFAGLREDGIVLRSWDGRVLL